MMNLANLFKALVARAQADTAAGGLFASASPLIGGFWPIRTPTSAELSFPYVVCAADISEAGQTTFTGEGAIATVNFHIFVPVTGTETLKKLSDIETRLFGDTSSGSAPSYGFQRHPLSATGWGTAVMQWQATTFEPEETPVYHVVQVYSLKGSA